ncbi:hypothetical protein [Rhodopirellula sp. MGV]|uniref:hypothetical protein n=1 Tax=Rhodopirellula sp. MGV TaxID=2023130 RepID=UPI000B95FD46|nr:hypothetical protein [Rhodopirellula sp. MGV]OYP34015.1 hypothetical protein CGZ80_16505 [Rhodopirellula sp. MGV]PNY38358.1 hypothetical protein C2E31_03350 [Rhodopirellula baltica]
MDIFLGLAFVWLVITGLGHLSWVVTAFILRSAFGIQKDQPHGSAKATSLDADLAATHRIVSHLVGRGLISPDQAGEWRITLRRLSNGESAPKGEAASTASPPSSTAEPFAATLVEPAAAPAPTIRPVSSAAATSNAIPVAERVAMTPASVTPAAVPASMPSAAVIAQTLATEPVVAQGPSQANDSVKAKAGRSIAELMADHNVRWGELIAGILIVVCSIGLVVSLWSTITAMHRVVPSLIFMCGNASIFFAGLYTLFRWKLQSSSRATLVIGTLLVPLGILAGLSTDGIENTTIQLGDPITVAAILGCGLIYVSLIWQAARALVGRSLAVAMTLGVAGPSVILPFLPTASRVLGDSAGWVTGLSSLAIVGVLMLIRSTSPARPSTGRVSRHAIVLSVTGFSLTVLAGYAAFVLRAVPNGWLTIADAMLPGYVILATAAVPLLTHRWRPKLLLAANSCSVLLLGLAMLLAIPSMETVGWFWAWAGCFSATAFAVTYLTRNDSWLSIVIAPLGIATVLSSSLISGGSWEATRLWEKLLCGEAMIAAAFVGLTSTTALTLVRRLSMKSTSSQPFVVLRYSTLAWFAYATSVAAALVVLPVERMGSIPPVVITLALGAATGYGVWLIRKSNLAAIASWSVIATTIGFWMAIIRPIQIGQPFTGTTPFVLTAIASSLTLLVLGECWVHRRSRMRNLRLSSTVLAVLASGISLGALALDHDNSIWIVSPENQAIVMLLTSAIMLAFIGFGDRIPGLLFASRTSFCAMVGVAAYYHGYDWLLTIDGVFNGTAIWSWASVCCVAHLITLARNHWIDRSAHIQLKPIRRFSNRFAWYRPGDHDWDVISATACRTLAFAFATIGAFHAYTTLSAPLLTDAIPCYFATSSVANYGVPILVFASLAIIQLVRFQGPDRDSGDFRIGNAALLCILIGWTAIQSSLLIASSLETQLLLATTLAAACLILADRLLHSELNNQLRRLAMALPQSGMIATIGFFMMATSSLILILSDWLPAIVMKQSPTTNITLWIASWWLSASAIAAWIDHRQKRPLFGICAALLIPATVILVAPLMVTFTWIATFQAAAIAAGLYAVALRLLRIESTQGSQVSLAVCLLAGAANAIGVILGLLLYDIDASAFHAPLGFVLTGVSIAITANLKRVLPQSRDTVVPWDVYGLALSGHLAILIAPLPSLWMSDRLALELVWSALAGLSTLYLIWKNHGQSTRYSRYQTALIVVATTLLCLFNSRYWIDPLPGLIACCFGVLLTASYAKSHLVPEPIEQGSKRSAILCRLFSLSTLLLGLLLTMMADDMLNWDASKIIASLVLWSTACLVLWRGSNPDLGRGLKHQVARHWLADREAALLIMFAAIAEVVFTFYHHLASSPSNVMMDTWSWCRVFAYIIAALTVVFRCDRRGTIETAMVTCLCTVTLVSLQVAAIYAASFTALYTTVVLSISLAYLLMAFWLSRICELGNHARRFHCQWVHQPGVLANLSPIDLLTWLRPLTRVGFVVGSVVICLCLMMLFGYNNDSLTPVAIGSIAILAMATGELATQSGRSREQQSALSQRLRYWMLGLGYTSIAMWSSTAIGSYPFPLWVLTTRWFVAWVITAGLQIVVLPKIFAATTLNTWKPVLRRGTALALGLAIASLIATLVQELLIRLDDQTDLLSRPLYLGMAAILVGFTALATFAAIASGPGFRYRSIWSLSDRQRSLLVVAAQAFGGLTWFHLFLCKSPLASIGLRAYWPYIVMTLSFLSVGITEWARRRNDEVLSATLKRTALFLPLIPVLGFWLSGSFTSSLFGDSDMTSWNFVRGHVSYQALLIVAAFYYGVISMLWKSQRSRIASILLANGALWVVLTQVPGWSFLAHPQAWLIPPAICVLGLSHLHREKLGKETMQAIRYACTLMIYLASSADMLIQGIGSTIAGPIVLITLALAGAGAGVLLRVRPFLYLGTAFVFIGVTSMVWHAGQQMDAVWPWWVFGIGTGVLLMIGLMAIEKNKPELKRIALSMQQWDA